jgi:UDP-4-amino-4,6-dideoxy-N-acetyl-beta-L-altrosamine transaminase
MEHAVIPYSRQNITEEDIQEVIKTLQSDFLTQGPKIGEFEEKFAQYVNAKYAVAVSNGTAALHLSCLALGIGKRQKVITTPITFAASANCVIYCGGEIDFCDIESHSFLMDLDKLESKLEYGANNYSGIIVVDFCGLPIDSERLKKIANKYKLWVIEDACHSPGGCYQDSIGDEIKCGSNVYSDLSCFSFHPVKHIACGEGGMITTNDKNIYQKLLSLRSHGMTKEPSLLKQNQGGWYYEMQHLGYNYRLPDINCALGVSQLSRADAGLKRRLEIAGRYKKAFGSIQGIEFQKVPDGVLNAYHLFVVLVDNRKGLYEFLRENRIFSQIHYIPVHLQPFYKDLGWKKGDLPLAEAYYEKCLSLPMYPSLTCEEQSYVIEKVLDFIK